MRLTESCSERSSDEEAANSVFKEFEVVLNELLEERTNVCFLCKRLHFIVECNLCSVHFFLFFKLLIDWKISALRVFLIVAAFVVPIISVYKILLCRKLWDFFVL